MTIEYLLEKKAYYEGKYHYFKNINFDIIAADYQGILDLISEMEKYINKEKEDKND